MMSYSTSRATNAELKKLRTNARDVATRLAESASALASAFND